MILQPGATPSGTIRLKPASSKGGCKPEATTMVMSSGRRFGNALWIRFSITGRSSLIGAGRVSSGTAMATVFGGVISSSRKPPRGSSMARSQAASGLSSTDSREGSRMEVRALSGRESVRWPCPYFNVVCIDFMTSAGSKKNLGILPFENAFDPVDFRLRDPCVQPRRRMKQWDSLIFSEADRVPPKVSYTPPSAPRYTSSLPGC